MVCRHLPIKAMLWWVRLEQKWKTRNYNKNFIKHKLLLLSIMSSLPYFLGSINSVLLLFMDIFYIVHLSDLEVNHINSSWCCNQLNKVVLPELIIAIFFNLVFVYYELYWYLLLTLPMAFWLIYVVRKRRDLRYYDSIEILNNRQLKIYLRESIWKLFYNLTLSFIFLYGLFMNLELSVLDDPPIKRHDEFWY